MEASKVAELKAFVQLCRNNPSVLADPALGFFRDYLESLGAKLPESAYSKKAQPKKEEVFEEEEEEIIESDVEFEDAEIVPPDNDPPQKMGDPSVDVTEEARDEAQLEKSKAMDFLAEGNFEQAIEHFTNAILLNPQSSILYANRARAYVKAKKPNAAIRDCDAAIKLNPDSARAYKFRGEAKTLLGQWQEAAKDLFLASSLDYDEETQAFLKTVEPKVHRIEEHRKKYDKLRKEREERRAEIERKRRAEKKSANSEAAGTFPAGMGGSGLGGKGFGPGKTGTPGTGGGIPGMGGGMPGMGGGFPGMGGGMPGMGGGFPGMGGGMPGMGGGFPGMGGGMPGGMAGFEKLMKDPEILAALQDPEISQVLMSAMSDPSKLQSSLSDPKIGPKLAKIIQKFQGGASS